MNQTGWMKVRLPLPLPLSMSLSISYHCPPLHTAASLHLQQPSPPLPPPTHPPRHPQHVPSWVCPCYVGRQKRAPIWVSWRDSSDCTRSTRPRLPPPRRLLLRRSRGSTGAQSERQATGDKRQMSCGLKTCLNGVPRRDFSSLVTLFVSLTGQLLWTLYKAIMCLGGREEEVDCPNLFCSFLAPKRLFEQQLFCPFWW